MNVTYVIRSCFDRAIVARGSLPLPREQGRRDGDDVPAQCDPFEPNGTLGPVASDHIWCESAAARAYIASSDAYSASSTAACAKSIASSA